MSDRNTLPENGDPEQGVEKAFKWTSRSRKAAQLVAENELTHVAIADAVGISRMSLYRWLNNTAFREAVADLAGVIRNAVMQEGIANKVRRMQALNEAFDKTEQVINERAADPDLQNVPGGKTGLVVRQQKMIGSGFSATTVDEYFVDAALLRERRETLKQAAIEVGDWTEKREHSGEVMVRQYVGVDVDKV